MERLSLHDDFFRRKLKFLCRLVSVDLVFDMLSEVDF